MDIDGATKLYGIIGKPISHSLSPAMHNAAFQAHNLNNVYVAFEVTDVARALDGFRTLGVGGVSVTIPHKQAVIPHLDAIDPVAQKIGHDEHPQPQRGQRHWINSSSPSSP